MKLTKRMKGSIIQGSVVNFVFLLLMVGGILISLLPRIYAVEDQKQMLSGVYDDTVRVIQNGPTFKELQQTIKKEKLDQDIYNRTLLKNVDESFYNEKFKNTGSENFMTFLNQFEGEISNIKSSEEYTTKDTILRSILPIYTKDNFLGEEFEEKGLTDYYFVNYIERLFYTFNLDSKGDIGVGNIEKIGETPTLGERVVENGLQEDIFRIPLQFDIVGQKIDVVNFIHFFENVGAINIEENDFNIHEDDFIENKSIRGDLIRKPKETREDYLERKEAYNMYKNQLADIKSLNLTGYPDSSTYFNAERENLLQLMKGSQSSEKLELEVELYFYVTGVPGYKMEKYINSVILKYGVISKDISKDAKTYALQTHTIKNGKKLNAIKKLQSLDTQLISLAIDFNSLNKSLKKRENIEEIYTQSVKYGKILQWIEESYKDQIEEILRK